MADRMGRVWALVLFNKIAFKVIVIENKAKILNIRDQLVGSKQIGNCTLMH